MTDLITIRIPASDWNQIVSDIENMCGVGKDEIEILQSVEVLDEVSNDGCCDSCGGAGGDYSGTCSDCMGTGHTHFDTDEC